MSSVESFDSAATYVVRRKVRRSDSEILNELHADDDVSDGEYSSNCSVGVIVDSEDEFDCFSDISEKAEDCEDLCVVGSQMPVTAADSNTDLDGYFSNRIFVQPKIKTTATENKTVAGKNDATAGGSINETDKLIQEEMELMELEKKKENKKKELAKKPEPSAKIQPLPPSTSKPIQIFVKPVEQTIVIEPKTVVLQEDSTKAECTPAKDSKREKTPKVECNPAKDSNREKTPKVECTPAKDSNREETPKVEFTSAKDSNREEIKFANTCTKTPLTNAQITSTLLPPRSGTPVLSRPLPKGPLTVVQRQQVLAGLITNEKVACVQSPSNNSFMETTSGPGSLPSSSTLLPTYSSYMVASIMAVDIAIRRERMRKAFETIDTGIQDVQRLQQNLIPSIINRHLLGDQLPVAQRPNPAAIQEPRKRNVLHFLRKQTIRLGRFIRRKVSSVSCISAN